MTKNEKFTEISTNAFSRLCEIADRHRGNYKPIYGNESNQKWWLVLFPAIHVVHNMDFNVGAVSGLTFPVCDISSMPINLGNKFIFPSSDVVFAFGYETKDLWREFLYPELTILMQRTR